MKKDISLLVGVGGVLAGRALSRQGNTELEIVGECIINCVSRKTA